MFELAPSWIMFDAFWHSLARRNRWLLKLRWGAAGMLIALMIGVELIPGLHINTMGVAGITVAILLYNSVLWYALPHVPETHGRFHGLHFALIQIVADLIALMALIYVTGGVESPFYPFFLFHIIIGSLILPAAVVSLIIAGVLVGMVGGAMLELSGAIAHHAITGLFSAPLYSNHTFVAVYFTIFAVTMFVCNYLANSVSKELYLRERALTEAYRKLEEAEVAKSRYVMSVVHDLKTPIAAAITYLNMIFDGNFGDLRPELEHPLDRSRMRLQGAITTINDILQLTQLKLAEDVVYSSVNVNGVVEDVIQEMRILFSSKNIRLSTWSSGAEDIRCIAEPTLLRLALGNILSNAAKYTDPGGRVEVHLKRTDDSVVLEVADDGIGIPQQDQEKIFQDFYRSLGAKKRGIEGTGLGLSVVQHIIRQLGGSIRVESPSRLSDDGDRPGSAFFVTLPMAADTTHMETGNSLESQQQNS